MEMMEIVLLIAGGIIFILSFFIPDNISGKKDGGGPENPKVLAEGELQGLISQEMNSIRSHVDDVVEEAVTYAMEKTERSLERLSNEKIMAVSEYSETVLAEIHKSHEEAMFLYDMLNNKHINLKNTVSEVNRTVKEAETAVMNFQKLTPETLANPEERSLSQSAQPSIVRNPERTAQENFRTEMYGVKGTGTGQTGIERARTDRAGTEKFGTENFGSENFGSESSRTEKAGAGKPQAERTEINGPGTDRAGTNRTETEKSGLERLGEFLEASPGKVSFMQDVDEQGRNSNERILELFQQGRSTVAIAKELGLGVGEVKLVIDLFKNQ